MTDKLLNSLVDKVEKLSQQVQQLQTSQFDYTKNKVTVKTLEDKTDLKLDHKTLLTIAILIKQQFIKEMEDNQISNIADRVRENLAQELEQINSLHLNNLF